MTTPPLLIVNARVRTDDPRRPWADAVWCVDGLVVAFGASASLRKRIGADVRVVDADGEELRTRDGTVFVASVGVPAPALHCPGDPDGRSFD